MSKNKKNILIGFLVLALGLLLVRVVFDKQFDDFDKYVEERENYEDGPEAYDKNLEALGEWIETYKKEHPGSTDEDAGAAFNAAWGN